jgi:hypothetical protein
VVGALLVLWLIGADANDPRVLLIEPTTHRDQ